VEVVTRARGGGAGGPASRETLDAEKAHRKKQRERQDRIDATIEGRPLPKAQGTPGPSERSSKPLPPQPIDPLWALIAELNQAEQGPLLPAPLVRPFDTGEEDDIEVLLLLD
jgi:hypothetical protein